MANSGGLAFAVDGIAISGARVGGDIMYKVDNRPDEDSQLETEKRQEDPEHEVRVPKELLLKMLRDQAIFSRAMALTSFRDFVFGNRSLAVAMVRDKKVHDNIQNYDQSSNLWDQLMQAIRTPPPLPVKDPLKIPTEKPAKTKVSAKPKRHSKKPGDDFMGEEFNKIFADPFFQQRRSGKALDTSSDEEAVFIPPRIKHMADQAPNTGGCVAMVKRGVAISGPTQIGGNVVGVMYNG